MTDPLTPEDRALYDAFFRAYGLKYAELHAAAGDGAEISLDACTVHSIKVMTAIEIAKLRDAIAPSLKMLVGQAAECFPEVNERGQKHFVRVVMESAAEELQEVLAPAPRIVSAVGVGVRVKPPAEPASLYEQIVDAIKTAPSGRKLEAINEVIKNAKVETPKLSAEGIETMRAARQAYGVCEWWDEITTQVGTLRRFKSSTCGAPEWRNEGANYPVGLTLEQYFAEVGRCQCGRVVVIRGEDELEEGGA